MRRRRKHTQLEDSKKCAHKTNGFGVGTISTSGVFAGNVQIEIVTIELGNLSSIKHTINCHPGRVHALHITKKQTIEPFVRTIKIIKVGLESGRRRDATDMAATMAYAGFKSGMCNRSLLHVQVSITQLPACFEKCRQRLWCHCVRRPLPGQEALELRWRAQGPRLVPQLLRTSQRPENLSTQSPQVTI